MQFILGPNDVYGSSCAACKEGTAIGTNTLCKNCEEKKEEKIRETMYGRMTNAQAMEITMRDFDNERHPCAAIGCTNTVPFADEPRCYTHSRW